MNSPVTQLDPVLGVTSALSKVDRAAHELRRGDTLVIRSSAGNHAVISAEALNESSISSLQATGDDKWHLVVTGQRAVRIGFEVDAQDSVYQLKPKEPFTAKSLLGLVDPTVTLNTVKQTQAQAWHIDAGDNVDGVAVLLLKHAGLLPACVVISIGDRELPDSVCISEADIRAGISEQRQTLHIVSRARVPLEDAENVEIVAFRPEDGGTEHLAIIVGKPDLNQPVLIRLHSECFTGDLLGSLRCDCGSQLRGAISLMAATQGGILLYLAQEGRGIGLINKLRAYQLQDSGLDTVDANFDLGFEEDERDYMPAVQMLKHLNVRQVRVLTNNPRKVNALSRLGVNVVERVAHVFPANRHNRGYLMTKGTRGGHLFDLQQFEKES
ncbi:MAG: GTP cyclohydrolase II [Burkholderiaceae bacterium]|nr:GTP cyclohydrolase II [Burkholderiaceae bacterium]